MTKQITKKQKIGVGYIRESTEEQDKGFSPKNQEKVIREYATRNNIKIIEIYKDLISGRDAAKREEFQRMIKDAREHKFDVILVYHTSRFARNVEDSRHYKKLLRKELGIGVISVVQGIGEPSIYKDSELSETIFEVFDEHFSNTVSRFVRDALLEKRQQGYQLGNPSFGYYKKRIGFDKEKNRPIYEKEWLRHKEEAKIVKRLYKLYATGKYSYNDLVEIMLKEKVKTKYNNIFTYSSMKSILSNKTYCGYVTSPRRKDLPDIKTDKHPAIISEKLFNDVQEVMKKRNKTFGRPVAQHRFYLLQGLVFCYSCIKYLKGKENKPSAKLIPKMYCHTHWWKNKQGKRKEKYYYSCKLKKETGTCTQPDVSCKTIDDQVLKLMEGLELPEDIIQMTLDKLKKMFDQVVASRDDKQKVKQLESKRDRLNFMFKNTDELEENDYLKQIQEINKKLNFYKELGAMDKGKQTTKKEKLRQTEKFLKDFKNFWNSNIGEKEQRAWIQMTIKRVWVKNKKIVAIEPQDDFKDLFSSLKKVCGQAPLATPIIKK